MFYVLNWNAIDIFFYVNINVIKYKNYCIVYYHYTIRYFGHGEEILTIIFAYVN
jgi:hypothetical protein